MSALNKKFTAALEVQLALAKNDTLYGFLKVNYQWRSTPGLRRREVS